MYVLLEYLADLGQRYLHVGGFHFIMHIQLMPFNDHVEGNLRKKLFSNLIYHSKSYDQFCIKLLTGPQSPTHHEQRSVVP